MLVAMIGLALLRVPRLISSATVDNTPPALVVSYVQPFIKHVLVTVQLNEDGTVWCGALLNSGAGTYTPSSFQLKTGQLLDAQGSTSVVANEFPQLGLLGLRPGTMYDVYCYAEDTWINGISNDAIAATRQEGIVTASGGDYVIPVLEYTAPYAVVANTHIVLYLEMSEDGEVWCVAIRDLGSGTQPPSRTQIVDNIGVDSWARESALASNNYKVILTLGGLMEGTTYDAYCFARDMSGNGIDGTPSYVEDTSAISSTRRAGMTTMSILKPSLFRVTDGSATVEYTVQPATWNAQLPRVVISGNQERQDLESWRSPIALAGAGLVSLAMHATLGCSKLPPAPRSGNWLALLRRGRCSFEEKASRASRAGFQGIVIIDSLYDPPRGVLADMTAGPADGKIPIPGWLVGRTHGEALASLAITTVSGPLALYVSDLRRKPRLGPGQSDDFGLRVYATS